MKKNQGERQVEKVALIMERGGRRVDSHLERTIKTLDRLARLTENNFRPSAIKKFNVNALLDDIYNSIDDLSDIQIFRELGTIETMPGPTFFKA